MVRNTNRLRIMPPPEDLPEPGFKGMWTRHAKARVVRAIGCGQITIGEAIARWGLNLDEVITWTDRYRTGGVQKLSIRAKHLRHLIDENGNAL